MTASSLKEAQPALSALTEQDSEFLKSLASSVLAPTLSESSELSSTGAPEQSASEGALWIAAFLGSFDPLLLMPRASESDLKQLLAHCTVSTDGTRSRWNLRAETRTALLSQAASQPEGTIPGAREARRYLERSGDKADQVTQVLLEVLDGKAPRQEVFAAMTKETLAANRAVLGWLQPIDRKLGFDAQGLLTDIELAELLEPFRFLTGFDPATGGDMFVGRSVELRRLRAFVDVLASEGVLEASLRATNRLVSGPQRVLLFSGVGGVGKSTLLAKFILQHIGSPSTLPFAYLDFDRSTLSPAQPATLLLEILRQLGWQLPAARGDLEELRNRIRQSLEYSNPNEAEVVLDRASVRAGSEGGGMVVGSGEPELPGELIGSSQMGDYLYRAGQILAFNPQVQAPVLLLVLDTFEEAQALGDRAVARLQSFLELVLGHLPQLKLVLSGRDEVAGFFPDVERMVLSEFSDSASRSAFLEKRGLTREAAAAIARQVGGRPLTLQLAARLVREQNLEATSVSLVDRFKGLFNKYLLDGILYRRILDHIKDPDVRALAHPGLVLRRIDQEVLRQVVAPVLGLGEFSDEKAERVLAALRHQKDLVRVEPDGSITHRADVREQMLVLMTVEKPELVRELHSAAASYYGKRLLSTGNSETRDRDGVEEIYHLLSNGQSLERVPQLWTGKARQGLAHSVDEIADVAGRGTLKVMLGRVPTADELKALPESILREYAIRGLRSALEAQNPEEAVELLRAYGELLPAEQRRTIEPRVLDLSGQWESARRIFGELVHGDSMLQPSDALAAADFFERAPGDAQTRGFLSLLLTEMSARLAREAGPEVKTSPLLVAALRLRIVQGEFGEGRIPLESADLAGSGSLLPISGAPSSIQQWILTLTDAIELQGPRVVESMPISDGIRGQLDYLTALLTVGLDQSVAALSFKISWALRTSEALQHTQPLWADSSSQRVLSLFLRHLMRPPTPQWYVPIACLLRKELGGEVQTSDLYQKPLPDLPFKATATVRTTKDLADFLGQLDQLGVLHICLRRLRGRYQMAGKTSLGEIVAAYLQWRKMMFFDLDGWFDSFEHVRRFLEADRMGLR
jgi:hypothetical protein